MVSKIGFIKTSSILAVMFVAFLPSAGMAKGHGFVYSADGKMIKVSDGCLHTTRWDPSMGECGIKPVVVVDSDGDGVNDNNDRCPGTPKNVRVDANGCAIDSDGDGVADYQDQCSGTTRGSQVDSRGCEIKKQVNITVNNVEFDFDQATLKDAAQSTLDDAVRQISGMGQAKSIDVTGHTDSTGPEAYNQMLSERRANAVKAYLEGKGLTGINSRGVGEGQPIGDNKTRQGRAKNRRVEIDVKM